MKVRVTAKDIRLGKKECSRTCPIAIAIRRIKGFRRNIHVFNKTVYDDRGATELKFKLPVAACRFIRRFDAGKAVKPFTFELKLK